MDDACAHRPSLAAPEHREPQRRPEVHAAEPGLLRSSLWVARGLAPFARAHWRWFALGALCGSAVVAARLLLPWPLRAVADRLNGAGAAAWLPAAIDPIVGLGSLFLLLVFALGCADFLERLCFVRFAIKTVDDVRAGALAALPRECARAADMRDVSARLIGDAGRIKSGLKLFLVHVATAGVLLLGMTVILFLMTPALGGVFAAATLVSLGVTAWAAAGTLRLSRQRRHREGEYAARIEQRLLHVAADAGHQQAQARPLHGSAESGSEHAEARQTKLQGIATWSTQAAFGIAVLASLGIGAGAVQSGAMTAGDMVVFMMYALMLQSPVVRLARQGAKTGKVVGASLRLLQLLGPPAGAANPGTDR